MVTLSSSFIPDNVTFTPEMGSPPASVTMPLILPIRVSCGSCPFLQATWNNTASVSNKKCERFFKFFNPFRELALLIFFIRFKNVIFGIYIKDSDFSFCTRQNHIQYLQTISYNTPLKNETNF